MLQLKVLSANQVLNDVPMSQGRIYMPHIKTDNPHDWHLLALYNGWEFVRMPGYLFGGYYRRGYTVSNGACEGGEYAFIV